MSETTEDRLRRVEERLARLEELLGRQEQPESPGVRPPPLPPQLTSPSLRAPSVPIQRLDEIAEAEWRRMVPPQREEAAAPIPAIPLQPAEEPPPGYDVAPVGETPVMAYQAPTPAETWPGQGIPGQIQGQPWPARQPPPLSRGDFERTVGLKWAGWFGAIVLVIGAALAIKFAYDQGWFGHLPDVAKLLLMSLGGFTLLAAGEVVLRRINRLSAVGLYGAGVAVLFLVGYAGYEWYDVYAQGTAFALMGAATLIGVLVAARADLVSIAVLSLVGGHIVPILLGEKAESAVPLLSYLLMLQVLALALCFWQATPKWWVLRSVSLAATTLSLLTLVVMMDFAPSPDFTSSPADLAPSVTVFAAIYWGLYQVELVLTTLRVHRRNADGTTRGDANGIVAGGLVFSIIVTAIATNILLLAQSHATATWRGVMVMAASAICVTLGAALAISRRSALAGLSQSLRSQAAALLVLAVPVGLDAENVVFGWLALAIAFGVLAVVRRLHISAVAAAVTWILAVFALWVWGSEAVAAERVWLTVGGVPIWAAVVVAALTAIAGHAVATLVGVVLRDWVPAMPPSADLNAAKPLSGASLTLFIHAIAGVVWAVAAIWGLPILPATLALLGYAWLLCLASFWPLARQLAYLSAAAIAVALVKWTVVDLLQERLSASAPTAALFNQYLLVGLLLAGSIVAIGWSRRGVLLASGGNEPTLRLFRSTLVLLVVAILTLSLSVEISAIVDSAAVSLYRPHIAKHLAWTMLWTASAVAVFLLDRLVFKPQDMSIARIAAVAMVLVAIIYLVVVTFAALLSGPRIGVPVLFNLQTLAGLTACGGLVAIAYVWPERALRLTAHAVVVFAILVIGSVEIDRLAVLQTSAPTWIVRQAGWSIWWSVYAVGLVVAGFAIRSAIVRILGLALFGLTLVKVVLVDLSGVGSGWRVLSFFGLGLLLLGTSVLYGKYGGKLLSDEPEPARR